MVLAPQPEQQARGNIDALLEAAGCHVCDAAAANIHAARGIAFRVFPLHGYGFADYLSYMDGKAVGVIEAKIEGVPVNHAEDIVDILREEFGDCIRNRWKHSARRCLI